MAGGRGRAAAATAPAAADRARPAAPQFGALLVFAEYDRTRKKELKKQRREEAERREILGTAREEREVRPRGARGGGVIEDH